MTIAAKKCRRYKTVRKRVATAIVDGTPYKPVDVEIEDKITKYRSNAKAFAVGLNAHPQFSRDGLTLLPNDILSSSTVGDLLTAIEKDYNRRGNPYCKEWV